MKYRGLESSHDYARPHSKSAEEAEFEPRQSDFRGHVFNHYTLPPPSSGQLYSRNKMVHSGSEKKKARLLRITSSGLVTFRSRDQLDTTKLH